MTPLAHAIAREICLPASARTMSDECGLAAAFLNPRCFECTPLDPVIEPLISKIFTRTHSILLPATETWIESAFASFGGRRIGWLVTEIDGGNAEVRMVSRYPNSALVAEPIVVLLPLGSPWLMQDYGRGVPPSPTALLTRLVALLAAISAPNSDRLDHAPHRGLQKRLCRAKGLSPGTFELLPWSEIRLFAPIGDDARRLERPAAAHAPAGGPGAGLRKAHHFCRSHMRSLKNGKIVPVRAHMRGDPALGTKRSWYSVQPRSAGAITP